MSENRPKEACKLPAETKVVLLLSLRLPAADVSCSLSTRTNVAKASYPHFHLLKEYGSGERHTENKVCSRCDEQDRAAVYNATNG